MTRRTPMIVASVLAATLLVTGCGKSDSGTPKAAATTPSGATFPATAGGVTLAKQPTHIISLSPTATEMLFAIGAGPQVIAVDDQSNYPTNVPKSDLSGYTPNAEAIAAKSPDLVVISGDTKNIKDQLTALKIPVYIAPSAVTLDDTYKQISELGTLTGHTPEATAENKQIQGDLAKLVKNVKQRGKPLTYYYELSPDFYSATSKTFIGSLFTMVGGVNNIADPADADGKAYGYPQLSAESIVKANPDLVFLADTKCCQQSADTVKARAGWSTVTAVQKSQIVALDDDIASRWGPRVVDLVQQIVDAANLVPAS